MSQLLDYHVGVLRGYLLALNAPQQVLHAAEMLLDGYRSRAGEVIGFAEPPPPAPAPASVPIRVMAEEVRTLLQPEEAQDKKHARWTEAEDDAIRAIKRAGGGAVDMSRKTGRSYQSVMNRIAALKREGRWVEPASDVA